MRNILKMLAVFFLCLATPAWGACTRQESEAADKVLDTIKSWQDLHRAYGRYRQCDDGALAEGFSEIVARLLANDWRRLQELLAITNTDTAFEAWVISHLDDTVSNDDLVKIEGLARTSCPEGAEGLCRRIRLHLQSSECVPEFRAGVGCVAQRNAL